MLILKYEQKNGGNMKKKENNKIVLMYISLILAIIVRRIFDNIFTNKFNKFQYYKKYNN